VCKCQSALFGLVCIYRVHVPCVVCVLKTFTEEVLTHRTDLHNITTYAKKFSEFAKVTVLSYLTCFDIYLCFKFCWWIHKYFVLFWQPVGCITRLMQLTFPGVAKEGINCHAMKLSVVHGICRMLPAKRLWYKYISASKFEALLQWLTVWSSLNPSWFFFTICFVSLNFVQSKSTFIINRGT